MPLDKILCAFFRVLELSRSRGNYFWTKNPHGDQNLRSQIPNSPLFQTTGHFFDEISCFFRQFQPGFRPQKGHNLPVFSFSRRLSLFFYIFSFFLVNFRVFWCFSVFSVIAVILPFSDQIFPKMTLFTDFFGAIGTLLFTFSEVF